MNTVEFLRRVINLHTRTVVALLDAAERADTPKQRSERIAQARDCVLELKTVIAFGLERVRDPAHEPERDPAHEHDMAKLRKEQLHADISPEEAEEDFQRRALDEEQPEQWEDDLVAAIAALPKPT